MISQDGRAVVVDPGDPVPVLEALEQFKLKLECILITHHHADHIGGLQSLVQKTNALVYSPSHPSIPSPFSEVHNDDQSLLKVSYSKLLCSAQLEECILRLYPHHCDGLALRSFRAK